MGLVRSLIRRYDRKEGTFIKLIEIQLMCAMQPPIAGKDVTSRFKRHFFVLTISEFEDDVMIMIFSRIVLWHLDTRSAKFYLTKLREKKKLIFRKNF